MDEIAGLLLVVVAIAFVLPVIAIVKASRAQRTLSEVKVRLGELEQLVRGDPGERPKAAAPVTTSVPKAPEPHPAAVPPPLPPEIIAADAGKPTLAPQVGAIDLNRPSDRDRIAGGSGEPGQAHIPAIDWEQFMGAKLFAWIGGLALFLGVAFFVKYSFEHNLVPPEVRVAIGFVVGLALVFGGVALKRKENAVTAQTLCATGILILYAVTFACRSYYHFSFFGLIPTFILMTLITAVAFLMAVRMDAIAVAILGMAGGFLTPILLSTGQDNPLGLFGYIALLDVGLLLVAPRQQWNPLPILGAIGTVLMQAMWLQQFFLREKYFLENKVLLPMAIFLGCEFLFCAVLASTKRDAKSDTAFFVSAIGMGGAAIFWGFYFLSFQSFGNRPVVLLTYLFLADIGLLAIVFLREKLSTLSTLTGMATFAFLAAWTVGYLTTENLYAALAFYFVFALLHSAMPLVLQRVRKIDIGLS